MAVVTWILKRLEVCSDEDKTTKVRDLYDTYKIETILDVEKQVQIEQFGLTLQRVFGVETQRKTTHGKRETYYPLFLKPVSDSTNTAVFNVAKFNGNVPKDFRVIHEDEESVDVLVDSSIKSNKDSIQIKIYFGKENYSVSIRETPIKIDEQHIANSYQCTKDGLELVAQEIKAMRLCEGQEIDINRLDMKENYTIENLTSLNKDKRIVRSKFCKQVATFGYKSAKEQQCNSCKRMAITLKKPVETEDNKTQEQIVKEMIPGANEMLLTLIMSQINNFQNSNSAQNKWDRKIINECLGWYTRSPQSYQQIRQSGLLLLPSPSLLIQYKNTINQNPGFSDHVFCWMDQEATRMKISECGRVGGLVLDEMSIQQKIELQKKGKGMEFVGFVEMGDESKYLHAIKTGAHTNTVGSHVLQFMFQGLTGFRFPFAHFVSDQVNSSDLYILVWEAVTKLSQYGFDTKYICMDGASSNRAFMKIHFPNNTTVSARMTTTSPCNPTTMVIFLMDPSHTFKKIRNNILKSGIHQKCTRILELPTGLQIHWQMWIDAFHWDRRNPLQIHQHLKNEHVFPNQTEKMRNHLAEDVLNADMLNLMLAYRQFLGQKGTVLNGAIELLHNTSILIDIFRDRRSINDMKDTRLAQLNEVQLWFLSWQRQATSKKALMSDQCHEDIQSTIIGFVELCTYVIMAHQGWSVTPAMINSDAIENIFCQHRGKFNGLNTNPTALQYRRNINGVILGQSAISKKSNAKAAMKMTENFAFSSKKPLHKATKRHSTTTLNSKSIKCLRM